MHLNSFTSRGPLRGSVFPESPLDRPCPSPSEEEGISPPESSRTAEARLLLRRPRTQSVPVQESQSGTGHLRKSSTVGLPPFGHSGKSFLFSPQLLPCHSAYPAFSLAFLLEYKPHDRRTLACPRHRARDRRPVLPAQHTSARLQTFT